MIDPGVAAALIFAALSIFAILKTAGALVKLIAAIAGLFFGLINLLRQSGTQRSIKRPTPHSTDDVR